MEYIYSEISNSESIYEGALDKFETLFEKYCGGHDMQRPDNYQMSRPFLSVFSGTFPITASHILLTCPLDLAAVRRHLRKFLMVCLPAGRITYFRFYDPRVLNVFLPTCTPLQLRRFFGPIETFWAQDEEEPHYNRYRLEDGRLVVSAVDIDDLGRDDR